MYLKSLLLALICLFSLSVNGADTRTKYNFNSNWSLHVGDTPEASDPAFNDSKWQRVTLPHAFNEDEAFRVLIDSLTDTVVWYRKHFRMPRVEGRKVFAEFEGIRHGGDFYLNGQKIGSHENGVMAVGFDLTPYIKEGDNVMAVRIDNDWFYTERQTDTRYQWNSRNFNANYGGIPKNVWLHVTDGDIYQTLPLYSNLGTTGVYVYATDFDIPARKATVHAESEVKNDGASPRTVGYRVTVKDADGKTVKTFDGEKTTIAPGKKATLRAQAEIEGLNFWSWGYGYLYDVTTELIDESGNAVDRVDTRTGFRKTQFADGKIWLNDRVLMMKGYAQRTSNEWPGVGMSVPAWLSDYSNNLIVESNGNLVRWMHVTPWKQDVESCDRVGLIQAMPAGDAEKDCNGRQWGQRTELMRDAIIYNRNNPSVIFYECGNESISRDHMIEMVNIRDIFDPYGGRAIGSREMLDINEAEYGGEMLYINKSKKHPMWAMEYCRDEGMRKYWDDWSYPYHPEGEGPLYREKPALEYNHNQDQMAIEWVRRWYDYWRERPGTGSRMSSGGVKIIFSDTNTHCRGKENYRRSGATDAVRIPKDGFFAHQVMWDGWVDIEQPRTYIIGHWNYNDSVSPKTGTVVGDRAGAPVTKPVYVVSSADDVELMLNGRSLGHGRRDYDFLFTFDDVTFEPGTLTAISRDAQGREVSRYELQTAGKPAALRLSVMQDPAGFKADGADIVLLQFEVVDAQGRRCPLDNRMVEFSVKGPGEWRGGIAQGPDNYVVSKKIPVECGINRALIRSTTTPGDIVITAKAAGLPKQTMTLRTEGIDVDGGLSAYNPGSLLPCRLDRGPTPQTASYTDTRRGVPVVSAVAGTNQENAFLSYDDNELSEWANDGKLSTAWVTYKLQRPAAVEDVCIKLTGWRNSSYPIEILAGDQVVWSGDTDKSLGYVHLQPENPVESDTYTIRLKGAASESDAFGQITEVAGGAANDLDNIKESKGRHSLRIIEVEFIEPARTF